MTVTIELPPETEAKLRDRAANKGVKLEDFLRELAEYWASANGVLPAPAHPSESKTPQQRVAEWEAFVASHQHITAIADDSRESIYEGCGE